MVDKNSYKKYKYSELQCVLFTMSKFMGDTINPS